MVSFKHNLALWWYCCSYTYITEWVNFLWFCDLFLISLILWFIGVMQAFCLWVCVSGEDWNGFHVFQNITSLFFQCASPLGHVILILASWFWLLTGCYVKFKVMGLIFKVVNRIGTCYLRETFFVNATSPDSCVPWELRSCQLQGWSLRGQKTRPPQQHSQSFGNYYLSR